MPIAMPLTIMAIATMTGSSRGSPSTIVELAMPTTGVARIPSDVVVAGRLRLTIAIAQ